MGSLHGLADTLPRSRIVNLSPLQQHAGLQRPLKHQVLDASESCPADYGQSFHMHHSWTSVSARPLLIVGPCVTTKSVMTMCRCRSVA